MPNSESGQREHFPPAFCRKNRLVVLDYKSRIHPRRGGGVVLLLSTGLGAHSWVNITHLICGPQPGKRPPSKNKAFRFFHLGQNLKPQLGLYVWGTWAIFGHLVSETLMFRFFFEITLEIRFARMRQKYTTFYGIFLLRICTNLLFFFPLRTYLQ